MDFRRMICICFSLWLMSFPLQAQTDRVSALEKKITTYNDALQYEKSIQILSAFISNHDVSPYEKYRAYLFKSYTYKRLFNYEETMHNLDLALAEGLKTDKREMVENTIKSEKAFVYFDNLQYEKASQLMAEIEKNNYRYLTPENKSFIIMQEGYLQMLHKNYDTAERKLDEALVITQKYVPRNLPNIYGKKIELYSAMKQFDKRDRAFQEGLRIANQYNVIKYKLYLYDLMRNQYQISKDYKKALDAGKRFDSLTYIYHATSSNGKIQMLEKQLDEKQKAAEIENEIRIRYFLLILISILAVCLVLSYLLYKSNKVRRLLAEKENARIYLDIEKLTKAIDEKGNSKIDLSKFALTERQVEIVELIKQGRSNKEIASKLFISENTVKYHLKIIYGILDIEHRVELTK